MRSDRHREPHTVTTPAAADHELRQRARALVGTADLPRDLRDYLAALVEADVPAADQLRDRDRLLRQAALWIGGPLSFRAAEILRLARLELRRSSARPWPTVCVEPRDLVRVAMGFGPIPRRRRLLEILAEGFA